MEIKKIKKIDPPALGRRCLIFCLLALTASPSAFGKLLEKQEIILSDGMPASAHQDGFFYKSYEAKEILSKYQFQDEALVSPFSRKFVGFVNTLGADRGTHDKFNELHQKVNNIDHTNHQLQDFYAAGAEEVDTSSAVGDNLQKSTTRLVSQKVTGSIEFIQKFKQGMNFDLRLGSLFSSSSRSNAQRHDPIRYGLVLQSIEPGHDGLRQAAAGVFRPEDMQYAGQAKVTWGIGPITHATNDQPLFNVDNTTPYTARDEGFSWSHLKERLPRPDFTGSVVPRSDGDFKATGTPPVAINFQQVDGFYRLEYLTLENFRKEQVNHHLSVPIYEKLAFAESFDESFKPVKTSAQNLLVAPNRPSVNVHYLNKEYRFQSDVSFARPGYSVGFVADTPRDWSPTEDFAKTPGEKYEITFTSDF